MKECNQKGYVMVPRTLLHDAIQEHPEASGDKDAFLRVLLYVNYKPSVFCKNGMEHQCARAGKHVVMLLYRPELAGVKTEPRSKYPTEGLGMIMVAKHRNGEVGDVYFAHNASMTKIGKYVPPTEWLMRNAK